ncbi:hypothetical protein GOOTI_221_00450 [Gordonia otitidis NBRC 100426]|uniref:Uncharacterized protein n=1 Tax=Gordonia otitidis (strain DSM 44809 / CCUG 52243 / JCM 12355 / NBRC 100426 / IFM 10032) TaxID=1108044 RepID=H5TSN7_GORO1|nr:hypothetical protein GOOTI_221_00450 [Gordonia otitidis NBRC 100426]
MGWFASQCGCPTLNQFGPSGPRIIRHVRPHIPACGDARSRTRAACQAGGVDRELAAVALRIGPPNRAQYSSPEQSAAIPQRNRKLLELPHGRLPAVTPGPPLYSPLPELRRQR